MSEWEPVIQPGIFLEGKDFDRWTGTERAMLSKHPDKFSKEACKDKGKKGGKMCPYAITASMEKKGAKPHYEKQETSLKGKPEKKKEFKDEDKKEDKKEEQTLWSQWLSVKESHACCDAGKKGKPCECKDKKHKHIKETNMSCQCSCDSCKDGKCDGCTCTDCKCDGCKCS